MVLSAVEGKPWKICTPPAAACCTVETNAWHPPLSLQWLNAEAWAARDTDRHTNRGMCTYMARRNTETSRAYQQASSRLLKTQGNPRRRDLPLYFSHRPPLCLFTHFASACLSFSLSLLSPPSSSSVSLCLCCILQDPQHPPLHPSLCAPPVSTLIF